MVERISDLQQAQEMDPKYRNPYRRAEPDRKKYRSDKPRFNGVVLQCRFPTGSEMF